MCAYFQHPTTQIRDENHNKIISVGYHFRLMIEISLGIEAQLQAVYQQVGSMIARTALKPSYLPYTHFPLGNHNPRKENTLGNHNPWNTSFSQRQQLQPNCTQSLRAQCTIRLLFLWNGGLAVGGALRVPLFFLYFFALFSSFSSLCRQPIPPTKTITLTSSRQVFNTIHQKPTKTPKPNATQSQSVV